MTNDPSSVQTLAHLYLATERKRDPNSVIRYKLNGDWRAVSDTLLRRQVRRMALYLRERAGLVQGECVAIISRLGLAPFIAELATLTQGAFCVPIDPALPDSTLADALVQAAPRLAFVSDPTLLPRLPDTSSATPALQEVVLLEGPAASTRATSWEEAMEMGTDLETPARLETMAQIARRIKATAAAVADTVVADDRSVSLSVLTHGDALRRLREFQPTHRIADTAYIEAGPWSLSSRLALLAFATDGCTAVALGTPGCAEEEIAELRPWYIVPAVPPSDSRVTPQVQDAAGLDHEPCF